MAATAKAIVVAPDAETIIIADTPILQLRDEYIIVKVHSVALNPADWKRIVWDNLDPGTKIGCDYSGVVEKVGASVSNFKQGDRVAGFVHGGDQTNHNNGAFGDYIEVKAALQIKIPDSLSFEQAATLGVGIVTCGQGLYQSLKLPLPGSPATESFPILIYGGSTATGVLGIQYAKASGLTVITTASPANFEYLKSLGADAVFDYRSPTCGADIRAFTKNKLKHAWDLSNGELICTAALSDAEPSMYGVTNMPQTEISTLNPKVTGPLMTTAYDATGEDSMLMGQKVPGKQDGLEFASMFFELSGKLLEDGKLVPITPTVNSTGSGLEGVIKGFEVLKAGKISATKLVYTL
ncbi:unnamed protein product [Clonostachys rosea f. rosea IK726]|uniref:Enoyl reductase (ER) domain-containing protein n=2 Tax=Bionectria ochroleuca TaxID=29856 RepID=A0A0B7K846_BIOOC|nr:unnamed protein product [Clonostachys rosea f. rosea IK726]